VLNVLNMGKHVHVAMAASAIAKFINIKTANVHDALERQKGFFGRCPVQLGTEQLVLESNF
jgi:UDP-N-acetylmuramyl pentapeptide synthase